MENYPHSGSCFSISFMPANLSVFDDEFGKFYFFGPGYF
jgi:hypothetical protein